MPCTTILVGKHASYDGSTMAARSEDSGGTHFDPKKFDILLPEDLQRQYKSVISHVEIELPEHPMRISAVPNAIPDEGIWAAAGVNEAGISMTATESITSNPRVLGADPLVMLHKDSDGREIPGGIGEEDMVVLVLPYIYSAREGVLRLGSLLEQYGTYEMNGIAFQDKDEIWWLETIGGHHWIARRLPDDCYAVIPNQLGIDTFDLADAFGEEKEHLCSSDLREFILEHHLNLGMNGEKELLDARAAFGSHSDSDHCYNTPRAWFVQRYLNPHAAVWDGPDAELNPLSDDLPWARIPEKKITPQDIKYLLSAHYQDTPFDPYAVHGDTRSAGIYRPIGVNRNNFSGMVQLGRERSIIKKMEEMGISEVKGIHTEAVFAVEWLTFGSNPFNAMFPLYTFVNRAPIYVSNTTDRVTTENIYWADRLIAALADACYSECLQPIERYQQKIMSKAYELLIQYDRRLENMLIQVNAGDAFSGEGRTGAAEAAASMNEQAAVICEEANEEMTRILREETDSLLSQVLLITSNHMKNAYSRSDH